jgi:hypothetical protein
VLTRRSLAGAAVVAGVLALCVGAPLAVLAGRTPFDLAVTKTHQGNFTAGGSGTFTVTFSAAQVSGGAAATISGDPITATDSLPNGLSYVTAGGPAFTCSNSGQVATCTATPTFTQGQAFSFTVVAAAASSGSSTVTNSVSYNDSFSEDTNPDNDSATDVVTVDAATTSSTTTTPTTTTSTSTAAVSPTSTITAPSAGGSPAGGMGGAGLLVALLATGGVLGSALGVSAWRRR